MATVAVVIPLQQGFPTASFFSLNTLGINVAESLEIDPVGEWHAEGKRI